MSARHLAAFLTLTMFAAASAHAQILYSYGGPPYDGPIGLSGNVIEGANGVLYGTAYGMPDDETERSAYSLTPTPGASSYTVDILHTGDPVVGSLLLAPGGSLYGFTSSGGTAGGGTFYNLMPPPPGQTAWTESILLDFPVTSGTPTAGPIAGPKGSVFGQNSTSVFQLFPPAAGATSWTQQTLSTFAAGSFFAGALGPNFLYAPSGVLYGTQQFTGAFGHGQIIALTPPAAGHSLWTQTVLYTFTNGTDGYTPQGLALDAAGALYGVTYGGHGAGCYGDCGTVFQLAPPAQQGAAWRYTLLHTFTGNPDGSSPTGVTLDRQGNVYGSTYYGGIQSPGACSAGCGTIFKLTKPAPGQTVWVEIVSASPIGREGVNPWIPFFGTDKRLYDITTRGGAFAMGEVFALSKNLK